MMKKYLLILLLLSSCTTFKWASFKDEQIISKKYVGNYIEHKSIISTTFGDTFIMHIKISQDVNYKEILAYSKKCEFNVGDKLYLRKVYKPGLFRYSFYQIENDSNIAYKIDDANYVNDAFIRNYLKN